LRSNEKYSGQGEAYAINSNEQMIQKINEVLQTKKDAVVNIVNDKLTLSVFSLLEKNLQNVKEINFVIRDVKFLPHQSEIAHEFEINPADVLFNSYDITEKNKLQHFSKAKSMHDFMIQGSMILHLRMKHFVD
jgi:hypothetical protein